MKKIAALLQFFAFSPFDHLISRCPPQGGGTPKAQTKNYFSRRFVKYSLSLCKKNKTDLHLK